MRCCCVAYPHGRGGGDEYCSLPEYDAYFNEDMHLINWEKYYDEDHEIFENYETKDAVLRMKDLNPTKLTLHHPTDTNGMTTSIDTIDIKYIDETGDRFSVEINFNKEEEKRLIECVNFFK